MASTSSSTFALSSSSTFLDSKAPRQLAASSPQCVSLPALPPPSLQFHHRHLKTPVSCRKIARSVMAMATGDAPAEVAETEVPEIVKKVQEAWAKVDDKYAVSSLTVVALVALWGSTGLITAIDRLPLIPGVLELVGIGYTGWFAYKNLVFKPDRDALVQKIKDTYSDVTGSS